MMINKSVRNSNVELLRIIAMLMILMLHVNYYSLGAPIKTELLADPVSTGARIAFEMFAIVGVNIFVLISGWYGIRFTVDSLKKYIFQCFFTFVLLYIAFLSVGHAPFGFKSLVQNVFLFDTVSGWFVLAYLILMIVSPALNAFCETATQRQLALMLVFFFSLQTVYGVFSPSLHYLANGYSPLSFIGLYLLSRYIRLYCCKWYQSATLVYVLSLICQIALMYLAVWTGKLRIFNIAMSYASPLAILNSIALVVIFASRKPYFNRIINTIAISSFSVYLLHNCNSNATSLYKEYAINIYTEFSGIQYLVIIALYMGGIFAGAVMFDKLRIYVWNKIQSYEKSNYSNTGI